MMRCLWATLTLLAAVGCAGEPKHVVEPVETSLETKGYTSQGRVGLNDKKQAILQIEKDAVKEYRDHQMVNASIREDIDLELSEWRTCRKDLADPRLGGNGRVRELPEVFSEEEKPLQEFGLDEKGELKLVSKELFEDKLRLAQKKTRRLRDLRKRARKNREKCERKLGYRRVEHGLPAERYEGEQSLDDAFRLAGQRG